MSLLSKSRQGREPFLGLTNSQESSRFQANRESSGWAKVANGFVYNSFK